MWLTAAGLAAISPAAASVDFDEEHPAHVVAVSAGRVSLESAQPMHVGDRFAIVPSATTNDSVVRYGVCQVDRVVGARASAPLPRGVLATVGDTAVPTTSSADDRLLAPDPWRPLTRARITLRPAYTTVGSSGSGSGFAMLGELSIDRHLRVPLHMGIAASPVSFITQDSGHASGARLLARVGYDLAPLELGLTVGAALHTIAAASGALYGPRVRVGTLDGLHGVAELLLRSDGDGIHFDSFTGELAVPVSSGVTVALEGGGARTWGFGMLELQLFVVGEGAPGTFILLVGAGFVVVSELGSFDFGVHGTGPAATVGLELRL